MDFKQLESFTTVVEYKSFTQAAAKLCISQPTISTHIRALEDEMGVRLLGRTTKSVEPTPEGEKVYKYALDLLQMRDRMKRECSVNARKIIHLGASTIPSTYIMPELLPSYSEASPGDFFVIHQSDSQAAADGVISGIYDVGLVGMPFESDNIACEPFARDRMVIITPITEHFLELYSEKETPLEKLLKEPIILREPGSGSQKQADRFLESLHIYDDELNITARVNDPEAIKNLVASGIGISVISERAARNFVEEKRLLQFELPTFSGTRELYVLYRKDKASQPHILNFVSFVHRFYH